METITYSQVQELVGQIPAERLPAAYQVLQELTDRGEALQAQIGFLHLPLAQRREILARQADELKSYYEGTAEERGEWQAGDFLDGDSTR